MKYWFIGIGGISMSALAEICLSQGHEVGGSDLRVSELTMRLQSHGARIVYRQQAENIQDDLDVIVYTRAVREDNPELCSARSLAARKQSLLLLERAELLGRMFDRYETAIAVAGTHGKTSTSSMITQIYLDAGLDPTAVIGGMVASLDSNYRLGSKKRMIIEACEYTDSFLHFHPSLSAVTNIDADHLDYFKDLSHIEASFIRYIEGMREGGTLVTSPACAALLASAARLKHLRVITAAVEEPADITASHLSPSEDGMGVSFTVSAFQEELGEFFIHVPGPHMVYDALLAIGVCLADHVPLEMIRSGLSSYRPTKKRFEVLGAFRGATLIDDYAHHPTEIKCQLSAAKTLPHQLLHVVFQPHTYSRTHDFFDDFIDALSLADRLYLLPIFAAREENTHGISSEDLEKALREKGVPTDVFSTFEEAASALKKNISTGDLCITMGAGDSVEVAKLLLRES